MSILPTFLVSNQSVLLFLVRSSREFWRHRCGQNRNNHANDRRSIQHEFDHSGYTACAPERFRAHSRPIGNLRSSQPFSFTWQAIAQVVCDSLNTLPNIGGFLFPIDGSSSKMIHLADLSANFAQTVFIPVQSNLNMTLSSVMSNASEFLVFSSYDNFTALPPSLLDQSNYLYFAFNTYLISQTLNGDNVYEVIARGTNPQAMAISRTKLNYDIDCQGYDEQNVCNAWLYSGNYESAFTLNDFSHMSRKYGHQFTDLFARPAPVRKSPGMPRRGQFRTTGQRNGQCSWF